MATFSSEFTKVLQQAAEVLQKQKKPISTLVLLDGLRRRRECAASKILDKAGLLQLPLPSEEDEGDSGIFTKSLDRALVSAELLAASDERVGTQHALLALARDSHGQAGRWLRNNGFDSTTVLWEECQDPAEVKPVRATVWAQRLKPTLYVFLFLGFGLLEGPNHPLSIIYGFLGVMFVPNFLVGWCKASDWQPKADRCCRCSREFELKVMLSKETGLCRICERAVERIPGQNYWVLLMVLALTAGASALFWLPLAYLLANLLLAVALGGLATFLHEVGHLLMAWLTGHRVFSFHVGRGPVQICRRVGKFWFYAHTPLLGGMVIALSRATWLKRLRLILFCLGGPAMNLLLAWACWPHFQASSEWSVVHSWSQEADPIWTFFLVNCAMALNNLTPREVKLDGGQLIGSDGQQILAILGAGPDGSLKLQQQVALMQSEIYAHYGNPEAQLELLRFAIRQPDRSVRTQEMLLLCALERHDEAMEILPLLEIDDPDASPQQLAYDANNAAWMYYLDGQFEKADQLSAQSVQALPTVSHVLGTRGEVLAAMGQFTIGKELIWQAVRSTASAESAALNLHALTRLAALEGDEAEFQRLNVLMTELEPGVERYSSCAAALESARTRGHQLSPGLPTF